MSPRKVALLGWGIYGGCGLSVFSFLALLTLASSNIFQTLRSGQASSGVAGPLFIVLMVAGIVCSLASLMAGLMTHRNRFRGPQQEIEGARIVGRYGLTRDGVMLTNEWEFETPVPLKFYVRMQVSTTEVYDYECDKVTFFQAGEGMSGRAEVQGRWLGRFVPYIGSPQ